MNESYFVGMVGMTESVSPRPKANPAVDKMIQRARKMNAELIETAFNIDELNFVDDDPFWDDATGCFWRGIGGHGHQGHGRDGGEPLTERDLADIRDTTRDLARLNPYAINGHENRISYIVGSGHVYKVVPKRGTQLAADTAEAERDRRAARKAGEAIKQEDDPLGPARDVLNEFLDVNDWNHRQQEIVLRKDRDGEAFLRFFLRGDGVVLVRFVEPGQVATPTAHQQEPRASFGILTDAADVETVEGYWVDNEFVEGDQIQHRKLGATANQKRGLPLFYPVRSNLKRAVKLLRNMSVVSELQSSIGMIRKHTGALQAGVETMVQNNADVSVTNRATGKTTLATRYAPGTIIDSTDAVDYEFPASGIAADKFVMVLQAELRAIASRLVMPEFMLTSDASNANFASTLVAEGPAMKMFNRQQFDMIEDDLKIMERVLDAAVVAETLTPELRDQVRVEAEPPRLTTRDRLAEAQADQILVGIEVESRWTAGVRHDLDPEREAELIEAEKGPDPFEGMRLPGGVVPAGTGGDDEESAE